MIARPLAPRLCANHLTSSYPFVCRSSELDHAGIKRALSPRMEACASLLNERPATAPTSFLKRPKTVAKGLSIFNIVSDSAACCTS